MKKSIYLTILFFGALHSFAQYHPLAHLGKTWYTRVQGQLGVSTEVVHIDTDTLINGERYYVLNEKDFSFTTIQRKALLWQDTSTGIVKLIPASASITDTLMYNFNLAQGDTFRGPGYFSGVPQVFRVDSVYTQTDFRGINRKVLQLSGADPQSNCYQMPVVEWIEGIGSTTYPHYPYPDCGIVVESVGELTCVINNKGVRIYGDTVAQCYFMGEEDVELNALSFYPNPVEHTLNISSRHTLKWIEIYDAAGKLVFRRSHPAREVKLDMLKEGLYLLRASNIDGDIFRMSLVKE